MTRIRIERGAGVGDPVHVWSSPGGTAPAEFVWRGHRYRIRAAEPVDSGTTRSSGTARRLRVRTTNGLACVLSQETTGGAWRIHRLVSHGGGR